MAITRSFKTTIRERAQEDPEFRALLLHEAIESSHTEEQGVSKIIMHDYINATTEFDVDKSRKA